MSDYKLSSMGSAVASLVEDALSGGEHSQIVLAQYYTSGYQVKQCFLTAYSWAFVALKSGYQNAEFWEKKIWQEFKSDAEQREALVQANELWVKVLGATKRG